MEKNLTHDDHDWHSKEYVQDWIIEDFSNDNQRKPILQKMLDTIPFKPLDDIKILDVGAGYGFLAEIALERFPRAHVTLLDFSLPMLDEARHRLANHHSRASYVIDDLTKEWAAPRARKFDVVVSAFAIHNLEDPKLITKTYHDISKVLKPNGTFLNYDFFDFSGGVEINVAWIKEAGFTDVTTNFVNEGCAAISGLLSPL